MTRLLIIKPSSLGDIVHGLQLAASLQDQVADLTIDWVVRDLFAPLVQQAVAVDRTYVFQRRGGWRVFFGCCASCGRPVTTSCLICRDCCAAV
jgi:heptosyltransferase I